LAGEQSRVFKPFQRLACVSHWGLLSVCQSGSASTCPCQPYADPLLASRLTPSPCAWREERHYKRPVLPAPPPWRSPSPSAPAPAAAASRRGRGAGGGGQGAGAGAAAARRALGRCACSKRR
jgi:hypothetical protein